MAINGYLAMTAAEFRDFTPKSQKIGWMACHFSPYSTGLSNCPTSLPEGAMLILNDRTPICGHDPEAVFRRLCQLVTDLKSGCVLLDFQRPDSGEIPPLVRLLENLPCPTAVSELYAAHTDMAVFLPPVPPDLPPEEYLEPWNGREIWLETALGGEILTISESGVQRQPLWAGDVPGQGQADEALCCHYQIQVDSTARFTLYRTKEDLLALLCRAKGHGVTHAVGLYQELGDFAFN